jgi:hypothetical protein
MARTRTNPVTAYLTDEEFERFRRVAEASAVPKSFSKLARDLIIVGIEARPAPGRP